MKSWIFYSFLLIFQMKTYQVNGQTLYISKVGWKISIPEGYKIKDTLQNSSAMDSAEKWKGQDIVSYPHNFLFSIEKNASDVMSAAWIPYDSAQDGTWPAFVEKNNTLLLKTFDIPGVTVDTTTGTVILAGIRFEKMEMNLKIVNKTFTQSVILSKQFGDHVLRINTSYTDKQQGERFLDIIRKSTFRVKDHP